MFAVRIWGGFTLLQGACSGRLCHLQKEEILSASIGPAPSNHFLPECENGA
jgi:hypothetical protein